MNKIKKIQVLIPFEASRGGAESLYQFAHTLRMLDVDVEIVYTLDWRSVLTGRNSTTPKSMCNYVSNIAITRELLDETNVIIVIPEIFTGYVRRLKNATVVVYWLSVNNYFVGYYQFMRGVKGLVRNASWITRYLPLHFERPMSISEICQKNFFHISQSSYGQKFIKVALGRESLKVYDYIRDVKEFDETFFNLGTRETVVLYNPLKGLRVADYLKYELGGFLNFQPIENMTHEEVRAALLKSAFYIDFGEHPGRDRIPREAILCGCCVISGFRGSAAFDDLPIQNQFKMAEDANLIKNFKKCLATLLDAKECKTFFLHSYEIIREDFHAHKAQVQSFLDLMDNRM